MTGSSASSFVAPATVADAQRGDLSGITLDRPRLIVDVNLLLRDDDDKVLLGRRAETSKFAAGMWSPPAGHLELGETLLDALVREANEELGITLDPARVEFAQVMHNAFGIGRLAFFFQARPSSWTGQIVNREPTKCTALEWFPLDDLPEDMVPYLREAIYTYRTSPTPQLTFHGW